MLTTRTPRAEQGMAVAEVVVAMAVLLVGLVATARATSAATGAQGRASARDRALAASYDIADLLDGDRCLFLTGAEVPADLAGVVGRCRTTLQLVGAVGTGEGSYAGTEPYAFTYAARWVAPAPAGAFDCASTYYGSRPTGVERMLDVRYREHGRRRTRIRTTSIVAIPPDGYQQHSAQRSNMVIDTGDPGAVAELSTGSGEPVRRSADPNGCIWFPLLRRASYTVRTTTATGSTTTVVAFLADPRATTAAQVRP